VPHSDSSGEPTGVQYVKRIAAIFDAFRQHRAGLGVSELSRVTGIHKSTTSRILAALREEHLVSYDESSRRYRLGDGIIAMAAASKPGLFLQHVARPYLLELNAATGETATLSVLDDFEVLTIDEASGPSVLRYVAWTGMRTPLHASASGKTLLTLYNPALLDKYVETRPLRARTGNTITDPERLRREVERTRRRGHGEVNGELEEGLVAVSAPIRDYRGDVLGVVNLTWPAFRVDQAGHDRFVALLLDAAFSISRVFGFVPDDHPAETALR
jgi:DNA-binding IclR family transcriptional regulator